MENQPNQLKAEGALESVIQEFRGVVDGPSQGTLLVPESKIAILLKGLQSRDEQINSLQQRADSYINLENQLAESRLKVATLQISLSQEQDYRRNICANIIGATALLRSALERPGDCRPNAHKD